MPDVQPTEVVGRTIIGPPVEREGDLKFVLEFVEKSNAYRAPFLTMWPELLDNYMVTPFGFPRAVPYFGHPSIATTPSLYRRQRSVLKDPESHQITETLAAQVLGLIFGQRDYLQTIPIGSDDYEKARMLARILMSCLEAPGVFRTLYQSWKNAFILGTSVLEMGWEARTRQQITEVPRVDDNGEVIGFAYVPEEVVYREGPMIRETDGWDFYPDPSGTRIQHDMIGVAKRFRTTKNEAELLARAGRWDRDETQQAIDTGGAARAQAHAHGERFPLLQKSLPDNVGTLTGFEYWGWVPERHEDGASNRVVTVLEGHVVRSTINPHRNGMIPFQEVVVNPMSGRFYGMGPNEVNRFLQDSADNMLMILNDAADDMLRPQQLIGDGFNGDIDALKRGDRYIECRNAESIKPMVKDYNAIQLAALELQRRKFQMREASGATNPLQGQTAGDRTTATEFSEVVRLASQRAEMMALVSERDVFPYVGRFLHSMLRQFMSEEGIAILNGEATQFSIHDIDFDADVRFVGSRQAQSKFQKIAAYERAIATMGPNLQLIAAMPDLFIRHLQEMEIPDAARIVAGAQGFVMQAMQAGMLAGSASAPNSQAPQFGTQVGATEAEGQRVA